LRPRQNYCLLDTRGQQREGATGAHIPGSVCRQQHQMTDSRDELHDRWDGALAHDRNRYRGLTRVPRLTKRHRGPSASPVSLLRAPQRGAQETGEQRQKANWRLLSGLAGRSYALRTGIVKVNVEPTPSSLLTQIRPPCSSTNFRQRVSPNPVPSTFLSAVPTCRNSSNT